MVSPKSNPNGGNGVDPTRNVRELVEAEAEKRDLLRAADDKFHNAMREAETRRIDQLAELRGECAKEIGLMLNQSVTNLALLRERQLDAAAIRIAELEKFRWASGGESEGRGAGRGEVTAWVVAGVMGVAAIIGAVVAILTYTK